MKTIQQEISTCLAIANKVVSAQGSLFIKELLRAKKENNPKIKIGITKQASLNNLIEAIENQHITLTDINHWIQQVEGWGKQHVYLYELPKQFQVNGKFNTEDKIKTYVEQSKYKKLLTTGDHLKFPKLLKLQKINISHNEVDIIWRQQSSNSLRVKSKDKHETIKGDEYEFRAFRIIPSRNIMRFLIVPSLNISALFIQLPLGSAHNKALESAIEIINKLFKLKDLDLIDLSEIIKNLDSIDLNNNVKKSLNLQAQSTKFVTGGASVEFSADSNLSGWKEVDSVREVRRSLDEDNFEGESGNFNIHLHDTKSSTRTIQMSMNAKSDRLYFKAQMTAVEMKSLIAQILTQK